MRFGLKIVPATFRQAMNGILSSIKWCSTLIYFYDIVIFSETVDKHLNYLEHVLTVVQVAGIASRLKKYSFLAEKVSIQGHVIASGKLAIAEPATNAIRKLQYLTTQTETCSFFRLCNIFRQFIPNVSRVAAPLNKKFCKDYSMSILSLTVEEKEAVESLKDLLLSPLVFALPLETGHHTIYTKACHIQIGGVLLQYQPG